MSAAEVTIRFATAADVSVVGALIRELAAFEQLSEQMIATESQLQETLFGPSPAAEVLLAVVDNEPVGFTVCFRNYSTFLGQAGLYLEDLYVRETARGQGVGRMLLASVARLARERGCQRLEWSALDWNEPAIGFYYKLGAQSRREWIGFRLSGAALDALAEEGRMPNVSQPHDAI